MRIIDAAEETKAWFALQAHAANTPYRTILTIVERTADALEDRIDALGRDGLTHYDRVLKTIEQEMDVSLSVGDFGEVFVLLGNYWAYGEDLLDLLTLVERRIVAENVEYRLSRLAADAEQEDAGRPGS